MIVKNHKNFLLNLNLFITTGAVFNFQKKSNSRKSFNISITRCLAKKKTNLISKKKFTLPLSLMFI